MKHICIGRLLTGVTKRITKGNLLIKLTDRWNMIANISFAIWLVPTAASGDDAVDKNRLTASCQNQTFSLWKRPSRTEITTRLPVDCLVKTKLITNAEQVHMSNLVNWNYSLTNHIVYVSICIWNLTGFMKLENFCKQHEHFVKPHDFDVRTGRCRVWTAIRSNLLCHEQIFLLSIDWNKTDWRKIQVSGWMDG